MAVNNQKRVFTALLHALGITLGKAVGLLVDLSMPAMTVSISLPAGVVVSAHGSPRDLNDDPACSTAWRVLSRLRELRGVAWTIFCYFYFYYYLT